MIWGWDWGLGLYRRAVVFDQQTGRSAPKHCPRCGRRMITRIVFYECRGCGYVENAPQTRRALADPPPDGLTAEDDIPITTGASSWQRDFALSTIAPQLTQEYYALFGAGAIIGFYNLVCWGGLIWDQRVAEDATAFLILWNLAHVGSVFLLLALLSNADGMKQAGTWVAAVMAIALTAMGLLVPPDALPALLDPNPDLRDHVFAFLALKLFFAAAVYCSWLASFLHRERRLAGF